MARKCAECPADTAAACRHAFGVNWGDKSRNGEGCDHPLDGVAEAWRKAGWTPDKGATKAITLPLPSAPRRPTTVSKTQLKMPTRPKVSAALMRQADLFFRKKN